MSDTINITKEMIINTAIDIIREQGDVVYVTLREISNRLNISTKPIFDLYDSVEDIITDTRNAALNVLIEKYINKSSQKYTGPKMMCMSLVNFAKEEPNLFMLVSSNSSDVADTNFVPLNDFSDLNTYFMRSVNYFMNYLNISEELAKKVTSRILMHTISLCYMCVMGIRTPTEEQCSLLLSQAYAGSLEMIKDEMDGNEYLVKSVF